MTVTTSSGRQRLLQQIASRVPHSASEDCVRVGVDGVDGAGKTVFADELAEQLHEGGRPVVRISVDEFHHPRVVRHRLGVDSPEGFWLNSFDLSSLRERVLEPLGPGGNRVYRSAAHDVASDLGEEPREQTAAPGAVLVLDGLFLHRDELLGTWDLSIFLQVPFTVSVARLAARDGGSADPAHPALHRYVQGQHRYFEACSLWLRADLVVDNTDLDAPRLVPVPRRRS